MSQVTAQSAPNSGGSTYRANINNILAALFSSNSGPAAPTTAVAGQFWLDTGVSPPVMRQRNAANTAWIVTTPETVAAATVWGNPGGSAAALGPIDMPTLRTLLNFPTNVNGPGWWRNLNPGFGDALVLPAGGKWAWVSQLYTSAGAWIVGSFGVDVSPGGTSVLMGSPGNAHFGFAWRVE